MTYYFKNGLAAESLQVIIKKGHCILKRAQLYLSHLCLLDVRKGEWNNKIVAIKQVKDAEYGYSFKSLLQEGMH
jgi:hypothetical protein